MTDYKLIERKLRVKISALRFLVNVVIAVFAIIKSTSGFIPDVDARTNNSVKLMILAVVAIDTLFCFGDMYSVYIFRMHYILNAFITLGSYILTAAVIGPLNALPIIPILAIPFVLYSLKAKKINDDALRDLEQAIINREKK